MTLPDEIAAVMARLERLRAKTKGAVLANFKAWLWSKEEGSGGTETWWEVWVDSAEQHFKAPTLDAAVALAEAAVGIPRLIHSADCTPEPFGAHLDGCDGTGCDREMLREAIEIEAEE